MNRVSIYQTEVNCWQKLYPGINFLCVDNYNHMLTKKEVRQIRKSEEVNSETSYPDKFVYLNRLFID